MLDSGSTEKQCRMNGNRFLHSSVVYNKTQDKDGVDEMMDTECNAAIASCTVEMIQFSGDGGGGTAAKTSVDNGKKQYWP